jgi:uncharacterized membrane protein
MISEVQTHIHSFIVHFPIAIISIATFYDLFWILIKRKFTPKQGYWLWLLGFITMWIAIGTGPADDAEGNSNFFSSHENMALLATLITFFVIAIRTMMLLKKKEPIKTMLIAYCILMLLSTVTTLSVGYYGGKMVYTEGIGVKLNGKFVNPPE